MRNFPLGKLGENSNGGEGLCGGSRTADATRSLDLAKKGDRGLAFCPRAGGLEAVAVASYSQKRAGVSREAFARRACIRWEMNKGDDLYATLAFA